MRSVIRPFAILPEVLSGEKGFNSYNDWKTFIKEALERMERGAVLADYGMQNAISKPGGFVQANTVLKYFAKSNFLYRWPKQLPEGSSYESIFKSLVSCGSVDQLIGIISVHQNTTGSPPESTHPVNLAPLNIGDSDINMQRGWWSDLMQQEIIFDKTPQNYKKLLVPLAKQGRHLEIWDPYFNPRRYNYMHWPELLKEIMKNSNSTFSLHMSEKALENNQSNPMEFSYAMRPLQGVFCRGANRMEVILRRHKEIPQGFHDRFIFTRDSVSIQFSWGIDCGNDHKQTVIVLTPESAKEKQKAFKSAPPSSFIDCIRF